MTLPPGARNPRRVGGGDINESFQVRLADGREAFVKTRADAAPGEYQAEAEGLRWLAEPGALRTPRVLEADERYLALEWVAPGRLDAAGALELGAGLAATHAAGAPCFGVPPGGFCGDAREDGGDVGEDGGDRGGAGERVGTGARFGSLGLSNEPTRDWPTFYAQRRLLPLARMGRERGVLPAATATAVERVCERLAELVGPAEAPARLHGDLWSGNVMADADGRPWLIDPSAYGGHREMDLAMLLLFGAPSQLLFHAYEERAPLAEGWRERMELYQLAPLLVHSLLFGDSYVAAVERAAARYVG